MHQRFIFFGRSLVFFSVTLRGGGSSLQTTDLLHLLLLGPAIITNWICVQKFPRSEQMKLGNNLKRDISKHKLFLNVFAYEHVRYLKGDQSVAVANTDIRQDYQP